MFVLMGETHHGAAASIASASLAEEKTMMWHQKLGLKLTNQNNLIKKQL